MSDEKLLTTAQAANMLGLSKAFLERDRWKGASIPYIKLGRTVRYRQLDIHRYLKNHTVSGFHLTQMEAKQ